MITSRFAERGVRWPWIAAIWAAGGLVDASQTILVMHTEGRHQPWLPLFATEFAIWLPWAIATPSIGGMTADETHQTIGSVKALTPYQPRQTLKGPDDD